MGTETREGGFHPDVTMDVTGKLGTVKQDRHRVWPSTGSYPVSQRYHPDSVSNHHGSNATPRWLWRIDRQCSCNDCAARKPVHGKTGRELYEAACGNLSRGGASSDLWQPDLRTRLKIGPEPLGRGFDGRVRA